jgi:hypothetical protein
VKELIQILVLSNKGGKKHAHTRGRGTWNLRPGQRVRIDGERDTFIVLRVDTQRHLADLLRDGEVRKVEGGIPMSVLRVVSEPGDRDEFEISA